MPDTIDPTTTAIALAVELAADARFQELYETYGALGGWSGIIDYIADVGAAFARGYQHVAEEPDLEPDFIDTTERVATHLLDRALAPDGRLPNADAIQTYTIWAAHQTAR